MRRRHRFTMSRRMTAMHVGHCCEAQKLSSERSDLASFLHPLVVSTTGYLHMLAFPAVRLLRYSELTQQRGLKNKSHSFADLSIRQDPFHSSHPQSRCYTSALSFQSLGQSHSVVYYMKPFSYLGSFSLRLIRLLIVFESWSQSW